MEYFYALRYLHLFISMMCQILEVFVNELDLLGRLSINSAQKRV